MHETAKMNITKFPPAADVIMTNSYVDDILKSISEAKKLCLEIEQVLSTGGFKIKEWVISGIGNEKNGNFNVDTIDENEGKVLGMVWNPKDDVFKFKISTQDCLNTNTFTRRSALSHTSKLNDPLGLLSPFT